MPSPIHEYSVLVIERHLDTFGHVNNATYLDLFEAARWVQQEMRDESGELCCDGRFLCALFDLKARRLMAPIAEWLAALGVERSGE